MEKASVAIADRLERIREESDGRPLKFWCFLHRLNLVIRAAVRKTDEIDDLLSATASQVKKFRGTKAGERLKELGGSSLKPRMLVRWSTDLLMLQSVLANKRHIVAVASEIQGITPFNAEEWATMEALVALLDIFSMGQIISTRRSSLSDDAIASELLLQFNSAWFIAH